MIELEAIHIYSVSF